MDYPVEFLEKLWNALLYGFALVLEVILMLWPGN